MKNYNSVTVGCNIYHPEKGLFISFYNEDSDGNETDTNGVGLSLETASSLAKMLDDTLKRFVY